MNSYQPRPGDIGLSGAKAQGVVSLAIRLGAVLRHETTAGAIARTLFLLVPAGAVLGAVWQAIADDAGTFKVIVIGLLAFLLGLVVVVALIVVVAAVWGFASRNKDWFSHSFIVHHVDADGTVWITEAVGQGVITRAMHYAPGDYVWLRTSALLTGDDDVEQMRAFLDSVTAARWKYDYITFAGLAIYCITGAFLAPAGVGTAICSGLTSEALTRGRAIWPYPAYRMQPQDQHTWALAHGVEIVETG